jgi:hypothetical protein
VNLYPHQDESAARSRQARLIDRSFRRTMELPDVYMWTQHTISDKRGNKFKSGLRDDFHEGAGPGRARPAWSVWRDLPGSPVV